MKLLTDTDYIHALIAEGEHQQQDFKFEISDARKIAKTLSAQTSPGTTRFFLSIHPLHLPYMIPCSYRASACKAVLPSCMAFYVISVRQTGDLPVVSCLLYTSRCV